MDITDLLMIIAILLAPLLAVQVQKYVERLREQRARRLQLFRTLMATRGAKLSAEHVQALNMIDVEFYGKRLWKFSSRSSREKAVVDSWKIYLDHLNNLSPSPSDDEIRAWSTKGDDLLADLLYEMSKSLGYDFDKVHLKRGIYTPKAHGEQEQYQQFVRFAIGQILLGNRAVPIQLWPLTPQDQEDDNTANHQSTAENPAHQDSGDLPETG